jgi:altronate dehydratase small subunit
VNAPRSDWEKVNARALVLHPLDNVATALEALAADEWVQPVGAGQSDPVRLLATVPLCHKFARRAIARGEPVIKYGEPIGIATHAIAAGEYVHTHNLKSAYAV